MAIGAAKQPLATGLKTTRVVRDEDGRILEVIHEEAEANPLNDPLAMLDFDVEVSKPLSNQALSNHDRHGGMIPALEAAALAELAGVKDRKKPRKQSQREQEWIEALVEKYGDDLRAMSRDRKLNPNQQTEADIGKRIKIWSQGR